VQGDSPDKERTRMAVDYEAYQRNLIADLRAHKGQVTEGPMAGRPLMLLTTKGAKSGDEHLAIVTFSRDGERYVICASKGGAPTNPAWYYNLLANPITTVEAGGEVFRVRATETHGAERDRLWDQHAAERPEFRDYPNKTSRKIPVFVLDRLT
jgi:deazaflavin-dependent oxidoreductase (nitroreductase family)